MAVNRKPDAWRNAVKIEVARLLGRSFERFAPNRMFELTNSPDWVKFLNSEYDAGTPSKIAARRFVERFELVG